MHTLGIEYWLLSHQQHLRVGLVELHQHHEVGHYSTQNLQQQLLLLLLLLLYTQYLTSKSPTPLSLDTKGYHKTAVT
jgi:hypothetical protein